MSDAARARKIRAPPFLDPPGYARHRPEATLLYQLVEQHYPAFRDLRSEAGRPLPDYVQEEFEAYLQCGRLEEDFLRVRCEYCHAEKLVAFSCKKRGFCPSCGVRRMAETAALLADEVLPERPRRQWVLSLPHALRFLLAMNPHALTRVLGAVYRSISRHLIGKAGLTRTTGETGAVTLMQRFGSALNLNVHLHLLFLDGVYLADGASPPVFRHVAAPGASDLQELVEQIAARVGQVLERRGLIEREKLERLCHPRRAGAAGPDGKAGGTGAATTDAPDEASRCVCPAQQPEVIARILAHLQRTAPQQYPPELPLGARAPPVRAGTPVRGREGTD
jgi:hypothetical protein